MSIHSKESINLKDDDAKPFIDQEIDSEVTLTIKGVLEMTSMSKEVDYDDVVRQTKSEPKERIIPRARIRIESISMVDGKSSKRRDI